MKKTSINFALATCAATVLATAAVTAQNTAPVLNFESAANALMLPDDVYLGEVGGVATDSRGDIFKAYAPYIIIVAVLSLAQWGPIKSALDSVTKEIDWPGMNVVNADGEEPAPATFKFNWLITPGTLLLISGILTMLVLRLSPMRAIRIYGQTLNQLK